MQFSIDSILMTLLVGTIFSVALAALGFAVTGFNLKAPFNWSIFRFFMLEDARLRAMHGEQDQPVQPQSRSLFQSLLLLACLFGLGVVFETSSDSINDSEYVTPLRTAFGVELDRNIRLRAFRDVGRTEVQSGRVNKTLRRIYTDHEACQDSFINLDRSSDEPCSLIFRRVNDFYYHAKNSVFTTQTYFDELNELQSRIDFMRSVSYSFLFICLVAALSFVISILAESANAIIMMSARARQRVMRRVATWWLTSMRREGNFFKHAKDLSATRLAIVCLVTGILGAWSLNGWEALERSYDRRIFGYYLCDGCESFRSNPDSGAEPAMSSNRDVSLGVPDSPYRVFALPIGHFEPSAIASLGLVKGRSLFVIGNDKDASNIYLFELTGDGKLQYLKDIPLTRGADNSQFKIEAISFSNDGSVTQRPSQIFVAGRRTFSGLTGSEQDAVIYEASFPLDLTAETQPAPLQLSPRTAFGKICELASAYAKQVDGSKHCDIEAVAVMGKKGKPASQLIIGVRSIGQFGSTWTPHRILLSLSLQQANPEAALEVLGEFHLPFAGEMADQGLLPDCGGKSAFAISDMAFVNGPDGQQKSLLLLTSYEQAERCSDISIENGPLVNQVQSALWSFEASNVDSKKAFGDWACRGRKRGSVSKGRDDCLNAPKLMYRLAHKAEGVAPLFQDSGTALVIFDDDASRKGIDRAPDTFPIDQNESVYVTLKLKP